jgi:hypothetical protein
MNLADDAIRNLEPSDVLVSEQSDSGWRAWYRCIFCDAKWTPKPEDKLIQDFEHADGCYYGQLAERL